LLSDNEVAVTDQVNVDSYNGYSTVQTSSFGFGQLIDGAQSYESINNDNADLYSAATNTTIFTPSFRGIGLPTDSYATFTALLSIASAGQSACKADNGGICYLSKNCNNYPDLWNYSFNISFVGEVNSNYIVVPLASFAKSDINNNMCYIYAEQLKDSENQQSIILGSLFF
jgi:hypothetical protein